MESFEGRKNQMKEIRMFRSSEQIGSPCRISAVSKTFCEESRFHFHDYFEIELVLGGSGRQVLNGTEYVLCRGMLYFLTPGSFHNVLPEPELQLINISFEESLISRTLLSRLLEIESRENLCFLPGEEDAESARIAATLLLREAALVGQEKISPDSLSCLQSLLEYLLLLLLRFADQHVSSATTADASLFNIGMRYLFSHFQEDPPVERIAAECGYTPNHFSRLFAKHTGKTYSDFLNTVRVNHARTLLFATDRSPVDVAFASGFSSVSSFYRFFRAESGCTPQEYRKMHAKPQK